MTLPGNQSTPNQVHNPSTLDVKSSSPNVSPQSSPRPSSKLQHKRDASVSSTKDIIIDQEKNDATTNTPKTASDQGSGGELSRSNSQEPVKERKTSDRVKKKAPWYSALYPTYKSRSDDFKRIFKDIPADERLVVDYSCAIQRDILVHGRLYVSQNYLCFYANIFRWETQVTLRWKDVTSLTKEKTALVIPNAILVHTTTDRHFLTSFAARDKAYLMLFRVWQNALMDQPMSTQEMWQWVHSCYGDELGLTSDDDDYVAPSTAEPTNNNNQDDDKSSVSKCDRNSLDSYSEACPDPAASGSDGERIAMPLVQPPTPTSPSEPLATDPSDSSPSESESEKLGGLITCPCLHEGRLMLHMQVSIHVDQLFTHLFTNSKFFFDLHETRKSTDVKQSPWVINPTTNQKGRTVSLTIQLAQAIGPKCAQVTESQKMLPCSKPGEIYAIEVEASNAGVPYADAFYVTTHYCLTRGADPNTSTLAVYCQIKYRKSVWGLVKNYIEKHCWSGIEEYYSSLIKALKEECERTRRAMESGVVGTKQKVRRRRQAKPVLLPPPIAEEPIIPLALPQAPMPQQTDTLAWIVFGILFLLLVFNAALYYKLWGLEQFERNFDSNEEAYDILRHAPQTPEDWKLLLQKQEELHTVEIERWVRILKASVHLLNQVEISLTKLQLGLHTMLRTNMTPHSVPKPNESPHNQTPQPSPKPDFIKQTTKPAEQFNQNNNPSTDTQSQSQKPSPPPILKAEL